MSLRSPLGRARGLGSAKSGSGHYWVQRLTAIGLVPLALWFVISVIGLAGADYAAFQSWLGNPFNATMMLLVVLAGVWHAVLGIQVVVEDYVHTEASKWALLIGSRLAGAFLAVFMAVSILKVAAGA